MADPPSLCLPPDAPSAARLPRLTSLHRLQEPPMTSWSPETGPLNFATLRALYRGRRLTPRELVAAVFRRIRACPQPNVWITLLEEQEVVERAAALEQLSPAAAAAMPLFGMPFAVKDNIDVAGMPTTAACPGFSYVPEADAPAVRRLLLGRFGLCRRPPSVRYWCRCRRRWGLGRLYWTMVRSWGFWQSQPGSGTRLTLPIWAAGVPGCERNPGADDG